MIGEKRQNPRGKARVLPATFLVWKIVGTGHSNNTTSVDARSSPKFIAPKYDIHNIEGQDYGRGNTYPRGNSRRAERATWRQPSIRDPCAGLRRWAWLSKKILGGFFDDREKAAEVAAKYEAQSHGVYFTLNPVNPDLRARCHNRIDERRDENDGKTTDQGCIVSNAAATRLRSSSCCWD